MITKSSNERYDWQYEVISRIEQDGGDPGDPDTWDKYSAEVAADEKNCPTCGGTGWMMLSEYPTAEGEHTPAPCIDCAARTPSVADYSSHEIEEYNREMGRFLNTA